MAKKNGSEDMSKNSTPEPVDFDIWWASVESKIPAQHRKEIIKADFRGRGLSLCEATEKFDEALKKYGVKLN